MRKVKGKAVWIDCIPMVGKGIPWRLPYWITRSVINNGHSRILLCDDTRKERSVALSIGVLVRKSRNRVWYGIPQPRGDKKEKKKRKGKDIDNKVS